MVSASAATTVAIWRRFGPDTGRAWAPRSARPSTRSDPYRENGTSLNAWRSWSLMIRVAPGCWAG